MTITELMNKYRWLLRLCPKAVTNKREKVRQLVKALLLDIAVYVYQGDTLPTSIEECFHIALQKEYHINDNLVMTKKK